MAYIVQAWIWERRRGLNLHREAELLCLENETDD